MGYFLGYSLAALCALVCAALTYRRRKRMGLLTGTMFVAVAAVNLSYLARIGADTYFEASVSASIYFVCLDFLILAMVYYLIEFTQPKLSVLKYKKAFCISVCALVCIDAACLLLNIFHEILMRYQYQPDAGYAISYMYQTKPSFYLHMGFVCLLIILSVFILIYKSVSIPKIYRGRYVNSLLWLLSMIVLNAMYLTGVLKLPVDITLLIYGFSCPFVYMNTFDYSSQGMLNTTRKMILEYMGTPMALFDYEGYVADSNKDMRALLPELDNQERRLSLMDFIQIGAIRQLQNTSMDQEFE